MALEAVESKNWNGSVELLKLCLQEEPDNIKAKAILLYAGSRKWAETTQIEELQRHPGHYRSLRKTRAWEELKNQFYLFIEASKLTRLNLESLEPDERDRITDRRKQLQRRLKESMRAIGIMTKDWTEVEAVARESAVSVFGIEMFDDDGLDTLYKVGAAVLLCRENNADAADFLLMAASKDMYYVNALRYADPGIREPLREEIRKMGSLIAKSALPTLMSLDIEVQKVKFREQNKAIRAPRFKDFTDEEKPFYGEVRNRFVENPLSFQADVTDTSFAIATDRFSHDREGDNVYAALISHENDSNFYIASVLKWAGLNWVNVPITRTGDTERCIRARGYPHFRLSPSADRIAVGNASRKEIETFRSIQRYDNSTRRYVWESVPVREEATIWKWDIYTVTSSSLVYEESNDASNPFADANPTDLRTP